MYISHRCILTAKLKLPTLKPINEFKPLKTFLFIKLISEKQKNY